MDESSTAERQHWWIFWVALAVCCVVAQCLTWYAAFPVYAYAIARFWLTEGWAQISILILLGGTLLISLNVVLPALALGGVCAAVRVDDHDYVVRVMLGSALRSLLCVLLVGIALILVMVIYVRLFADVPTRWPWPTFALIGWGLFGCVVCWSYLRR